MPSCFGQWFSLIKDTNNLCDGHTCPIPFLNVFYLKLVLDLCHNAVLFIFFFSISSYLKLFSLSIEMSVFLSGLYVSVKSYGSEFDWLIMHCIKKSSLLSAWIYFLSISSTVPLFFSHDKGQESLSWFKISSYCFSLMSTITISPLSTTARISIGLGLWILLAFNCWFFILFFLISECWRLSSRYIGPD